MPEGSITDFPQPARTTRTSVNVTWLAEVWRRDHPRPEWDREDYWEEARPDADDRRLVR